MDIRSLRYFVAAAEESSLTVAARRLGISQPALSKAMAELEGELGTALLVRGGRGTALTDAGRVLYDRAREIIGMSERTATEVRSVGQDSGCDVYVGLGESPDIDSIAEAFGRVCLALPDSRLHLYTDNAEGIRSKLEMGFIDIGVTLGPVDEGAFEGFPTGRTTRFGVLVREDDPLASEPSVGRDGLRGVPIIALRGADRHAGLTEMFGDIIGRQTVATYNLINNAAAMVRAGTGTAVTLEWLVGRTDASGLAFRPLRPETTTGSCVVWLKGRRQSSTASALIAELMSMRRCPTGVSAGCLSIHRTIRTPWRGRSARRKRSLSRTRCRSSPRGSSTSIG